MFQKSVCQKLENLSIKLGHFGVTLRKNYGSYEVAQSFYRCKKIQVSLETVFELICVEIFAVEAQKVFRADSTPPHSIDRPESPP